MTTITPTSTRTVSEYIDGVRHVKPTSATLTRTNGKVSIVLHHNDLVDVTIYQKGCYWGTFDAAECAVKYIADALDMIIPVIKTRVTNTDLEVTVYNGNKVIGTLKTFMASKTFSFEAKTTKNVVIGALASLTDFSVFRDSTHLNNAELKHLVGDAAYADIVGA